MSSVQAIELNLGLWPRQLEALESDATEMLFGGASEGGKSHLIRVALITWCLTIKALQCVLIRKKYDDILRNHVEGPTGFKALLAPLLAAKQVEITQKEIRFLKQQSIIAFQHCQDERQFDSAQGVEKHVLVIDEATQISERLIRFFRGWVRMPKQMQEQLPPMYRGRFPRILYTANPTGPSLGFFKRNFVKARPKFEIEPIEGFKRQYIPSRAGDNKAVDLAALRGRLEGLGDPALARALIEGDWDAPTGDFLSEYDESRHVVPDFIPPEHWFRYRSFDWGTAEPFAAYWIAVSDGESFKDEEGRHRWFPRGALVYYREWYGCHPEDPAKGNRMRNEDIAQGIILRSPHPAERNLYTITDSLPFQDRGGETIAQVFENSLRVWGEPNKETVPLIHGDTSRIPGWSQLRSRLIGVQLDSNSEHRDPMIFFTESCTYAREYIPALPRHPSEAKKEDAAEHGEATHCCDAIRLGCMARALPTDKEPELPDPADIHNVPTMDDAIAIVQRYKRVSNGIY